MCGCAVEPDQKNDYAPADIAIPTEQSLHAWTVDLNDSEIAFEAYEKRKIFSGQFSRFNVSVTLDLDNPSNGQIRAIIDLDSADAGNADRNDVLKTAEWFYLDKFPIAEFISNDIRRTGPNSFEAKGKLSIKDVTKEIVLPFTLSQNEDETLARATYEFNRLDYKIGVGSFADEKYVGYPVKVIITVKASQ